MEEEHLARILRNACCDSKEGTMKDVKRNTIIHLFGIRYAREFENTNVNREEVMRAICREDATELRKGIDLSKFVGLTVDVIHMFEKADRPQSRRN